MLRHLYRMELRTATGGTISLNEGEYLHEQSDGFGMPPLAHQTYGSPAQEGRTLAGVRLLPRRLRFCVKTSGRTPADYFLTRACLLDILRPLAFDGAEAINGPAHVLAVTDALERTWLLDVELAEGLSLPFEARRLSSLGQEAAFTLAAYDPVWYSSGETALSIATGEIGREVIAEYEGNWPAPVEITLWGPLTHPVVERLNGNVLIDVDYDLPAGHSIYINTGWRRRAVLLDGSTSLLHLLSVDSDLDLRLLPDPEAPLGENSLRVRAQAVGAGASASVRWHSRRIGL